MNGTTDVINTKHMTRIHHQTTDLINQQGHVPNRLNAMNSGGSPTGNVHSQKGLHVFMLVGGLQ